MSKTILAKVDGFTPVIDDMIPEVGLMTATIFGKVWRYCQMADGVCSAAQERMAKELGISRVTFNGHLETLVEKEYLQDITPNLLGVPHTYRDTGKAGVSINLIGRSNQNQPVKNLDTPCKETLQPPVKNLYTKIEVKKEDNIDTTTRAKIFSVYSQEIGPITPMIAESINGYIDDPKCPDEYIIDALKEAALLNSRNWKYAEAILRRWMVEGKTARTKTPVGPKYPNRVDKGSRAELMKQLEAA